jgi:protein-S-isoprenylcysteine O-methyltransferase Ste14
MAEPAGASAPRGAANLGLARPPLVFLAAILAGLGLERAWPLAFLPSGLPAELGAPLALLAGALFAWSLRSFRRAGTSVRGSQPTRTLVRSGPYRFTRNPIYLAFSLLQLGIAVWVDGAWLLVTLAGALALVACVVVPREERYLAARFAAEYGAYRARVPRWLLGRAGLLALFLAFLVWALSPALTGHGEPWDADFPFYTAAFLGCGSAVGLCFPQRLLGTWLGAWLGQLAALLLLPGHDRSWFLLGALTTALGSTLFLPGAALGSWLRRRRA